jgi:hypothetical protein
MFLTAGPSQTGHVQLFTNYGLLLHVYISLVMYCSGHTCCTAACCRGQPPKYRPLRYGTHLEGKVLTNFELEEAAC